jgi:N-acetylmuramic acid 6-phosphate (MurNAc-6-P) etherase
VLGSGREWAPYVPRRAAHRGRRTATIFLACVPKELAPDEADVSIRAVTGRRSSPEHALDRVATKMVLNLISTLAMVRPGRSTGT